MFNRHPAIGRKVIINLFSGNAIEGVLIERIGDQYLIRAAVVHEMGADSPIPADGEVCIDTANVDYIQMLVSVDERR